MKSKITKIQSLKKGIAIFLVLLFMLTPMATIVYADTGSDSGDDSQTLLEWFELLVYGKVGVETREFEKAYAEETTIHIKNEVQLRALAQLVNNGKDCSGKEIYLDNNIDMSGSTEEWVPIGNEENKFEGKFDGQGYGITGIRFSKAAEEYPSIGLFGVIGENGTVKNLKIDEIKYDINSESAVYNNVGNIAGTNYGTIENCINTANIKGESYVGGIVGINKGKITSCTNIGNVEGKEFVGGIAGGNEGSIFTSRNDGIIVGTEHGIGGIAGVINNGAIELSYNLGEIKGNSEKDVGAIVGGNYSGNAAISYCLNEGVVNSLIQVDKTSISGESEVYIIKGKTDNTRVDSCVYLIKTINGNTEYIADVKGATNSYVAEFDIRKSDWEGSSIIFRAAKIKAIKREEVPVYSFQEIDVDGDGTVDQKIILNPELKIGYQAASTEEGEGGEEPSRKDYRIEFEETSVAATVKLYKKDAASTEDTYVEITEDTYLKTGDTLKIETVYNNAIYKGLVPEEKLLITTAPKLFIVIGEGEKSQKIEIKPKTINEDGKTVTYTEQIKIGTPNGKVTGITLESDIDYYVKNAEGHSTISFGADGKSVVIDKEEIIIDTKAPLVDTKIYVEDNLKTERYTVGKQIWFEVTTTERIQANKKDEEGKLIVFCEPPRIQVKFSESGVGKYNYQLEEDKEGIAKGYAKPESAIINKDGTTTWLYSYEVQEFDEGYVEFDYISGLITDIAGNQTDLQKLYETSSEVTEEEITGTVLGEDAGLNVTYKFYKNEVEEGNEIARETYFTNEDDLIVVAEFDKVLYVHYGLSDGKNTNVRLNDAHKDRAPSLYLNADSVFVAKCEEIYTTDYVEATESNEAKSGTTSLQYKFEDIAKEYNLNKLTEITKVILKNENNANKVVVNGTEAATNGLIPYAEKWYETYNSEQEEEYNTTFEAGKVIVVSELDNIIIDPIGVTTRVEESNIYADTTAPTVTITANRPNPTNANVIKYTFTFSEYVKEFTVEDITVNNGEKVTEKVTVDGQEKEVVKFVEVEEGRKYTLEVKPTTTTGNKETLQVFIAGRACKDLVGIGNIAQESNITIDKVQPIFISWNINKDDDKNVVIVEAIFNEAISEAPELALDIGGYESKGAVEIECVENKVIYTYEINAADGGKVKATLSGKAKDVAGNDSNEINEVLESGFELSRTEIKPNENEEVTYTFEKNSVSITDFANPIYFVRGDKITVTKHWMENKVDAEGKVELGEDGNPVLERKEAKYEYKVSNTINCTQMKYMTLSEPTLLSTVGKVEFSATSGNIDITKANIYFDTVKPTLTLSAEVEKQNENNIYKEGQKIIILAKTSEAIQSKDEIPQLNVVFSVSGIGKYNYQGTNSEIGNAQYTETIENQDGTITWKYEYIVQNGDEGSLKVEYDGKLVDLAGNETILEANPIPSEGEINLSNIVLKDKESTLTYEFYKNNNLITNFKQNTYFRNNDTIKVKVKFSNELYSVYGSTNTVMDIETVPQLTIDGKEFTAIEVSEDGKEITYSYTVNGDDNKKLEKAKLTLKKELYAKKADNSYETISSLPETEIINCNLHIYKASTEFAEISMKVDTTVPTVTISTNKTNPTKDSEITYTFTWSEEVKGFGAEDIIVPETAVKGELVAKGNNVYTMTVNYDTMIPNGNQGEVTVAVVENAAEDLVNNKNAYVSNTLKIDRIAPIMESLVAYVESSSEVQVDTVKEYYKSGDVIKVVATFNESVKVNTVPTLALQFSESGNAKGSVRFVVVSGNKITYTYTITEKDLGTLSVKGFSGKVADAAGNETIVTKKALEGDTIIADTIAPQLVGITAVVPNFAYDSLVIDGETKRYGKDTTITIITEYSENVYNLTSNKVNAITNTVAPTLKLKFGETVREATFDKVEGSKVYYIYNIGDGDKGNLSIVSLEGNVSDIAGNTLEVKENSPEFGKYEDSITEENQVDVITADANRSNITFNVTGVNYDDDKNVITGNGTQYRKGAVITVTATTDEYVYKNIDKILERFTVETAPELKIRIDQNAVEGVICKEVKYENNKTIFTYTYEIKEGDNGQLEVAMNMLKYFDIALNGNTALKEEISIYADTIRPHYKDQPDIQYVNESGVYKVEFNEKLYYLDDNNVVREFGDLNYAPKLKFEDNETVYNPVISENVITYSGEKINAKPALGASRLCDKAGNTYAYYDQFAPSLESIKVTSPETGTYKIGEEVTIVATFNEILKGTAPTLTLKFANSGDAKGTVSAGVIENNTITYTYTITAGDNGVLQVKSLVGTELSDSSNNKWAAPESITLSGNTITADTIKPFVEKVEVKDGDNVTASYVRNPESRTPVKTNSDEIEYIITFNEDIQLINEELIKVINGNIIDITCEGKIVEVKVKVTTEGVQTLRISEGAVIDAAKVGGNANELFRFDDLTVDFTRPTIRFVSEYNGGIYVIPTATGKVQIRTNIEINENISKIEYKWDNANYAEITEYSSASDIVVPKKEFTQAGKHTLSIKATDMAGNIQEVSKEYSIVASTIGIVPSTNAPTNSPVTVTVTFGEGLTDNINVVFRAQSSQEFSKIVLNENGTCTITENGKVYVEATDKAKNKVFNEISIENIDTVAPIINFSEIPNGILKGEAVEINITTDEPANIKYSWDKENWENYTNKITERFEEPGEYVLYAKATDRAGNESQIYELRIVVSELDFEVYGNVEDWTKENIELYVSTESDIASITVNGQAISIEDRIYPVTENGDYEIVVTDKYGNSATKTEKVEKIDKELPVISDTRISKLENSERVITITAADSLSGIAGYAITDTTEYPIKWSDSNEIKITHDGVWYAWVIDRVGNIKREVEPIILDTTGPVIRFDNTVASVVDGAPLVANIVTNEEAKILYSWDNQNWAGSEEFIKNVRVEKKYEMTGKYTLFVKATDKVGNESEAQIQFTVTNAHEVLDPQVEFEGLYTTQINGVKYVKIANDMTAEDLTNAMKTEALCGQTPGYTNLTEEKTFKTGSEIVLNGDVKYVVVVKGDVNCDGGIDFVKDIIRANNYRLGIIQLDVPQMLAADVNNNGEIEFIQDLIAINNYRLGLIKSL